MRIGKTLTGNIQRLNLVTVLAFWSDQDGGTNLMDAIGTLWTSDSNAAFKISDHILFSSISSYTVSR